jgi:predicted N-acyltransferase
MPMETRLFDSIDEVPAEVWDGLAGRGSVAVSRTFWSVLERSGLNDFQYRYAVLYDDAGTPAGLYTFYSVTTDIAIFAPPPLRGLLDAVRRVFPGFLKWKMLECGTPITIVSPPYVKTSSLSSREMVDRVAEVLLRTARREGHLLIVARDFEEEDQALRGEFARHGFHWIESLPNTYLTVRWDDSQAYLRAMRSYYRSKLLKHRRRNVEAGVRHELVEDFADRAETLCAQWLVVHTHAKEFQREVLTPAFYRELSQQMGPLSKVLLFYRGSELLGHALLLQDGELMRWLYVGRETPDNDGLYLYIAATVVETAIELGAKRVEMGLTTYSIKQDLGAEVVPIGMALRATRAWLNPFVGWGYGLLNSVPKPEPRNVFKQAEG